MKLVLKRISKYLLYFFILVFISFYIALGILYKSQIPHKFIKNIVEKELSKVFFREVTIEKMSGNIITNARLKKIKFANNKLIKDGTIIEIEDLTAIYNPLKFLSKKGDVLASISELYLNNIQVNVVRTKNDEWNILNFLPPPPKVKNPPPPPFSGKIFFHNMQIDYKDERGWKKEILSNPFSESFVGVGGSIDFANKKKAEINLTGSMASSKALIQCNGFLNSYNAQYELKIFTPTLIINKWGDYAFPLENYKVFKNIAMVSAQIKSKTNPLKIEIPFYYDVDIWLRKNSFKMPFFQNPITELQGKVNLKDDKITLTNIEGEMDGIKFLSYGNIFLKQNLIDLKVQSQPFEMSYLKKLFPTTENWNYQGKAISNLVVSNNLNNPLIKGVMKISEAKIYAFSPQNVEVGYDFIEKKLNYSIKKGTIFNGTISGDGKIDFNSPYPILDLKLQGKKLAIQNAFPKMKEIEGEFSISLNVKGESKKFILTTDLLSSDVKFYQQKINKGHFVAEVLENKDVFINKGAFYINKTNNGLDITGTIKNLFDTKLSFNGVNMAFNDPDKENLKGLSGTITLKGTLNTELNPNFWINPIDELTSTFDINLNSYTLYKQFLEKAQLNFTYNKGHIRLYSFKGTTGKEMIFCSGDFYKMKPLDIILKTKSFDVEKSALIQKLIPEGFKPLGGDLDLEARVIKNSKTAQDTTYNRYIIESKTELNNGYIAGQILKNLLVKSAWDGRNLTILDGVISQQKSNIYLTGTIIDFTNLNITLQEKTFIDFAEFPVFTSKYGAIKGSGKISGNLSGSAGNLKINFKVSLDNPQLNYNSFDKIEGNIIYQEQNLKLNKCLFQKYDDQYNLTGEIDLSPLFKEKNLGFRNFNYNFDLDIAKANLDSLSEIVGTFIQEVKSRAKQQTINQTEIIKNPNAQVKIMSKDTSLKYKIEDTSLNQFPLNLFRLGDGSKNFQFFNNLKKEQAELTRPAILGIKQIWQGNISGKFHIEAKKKNVMPILDMDILLTKAQIAFLKAEKIQIKTQSQKKQIKAELEIKKGNIGGKDFDRIWSRGFFNEAGVLKIERADITAEGRTNEQVIYGVIPAASLWDNNAPKELDLDIILYKNDIGVLSILNKYIQNIQNDGDIYLRLTGSLKKPMLNSKYINLVNAKLFLTANTIFKSPFVVTENRKIKIINNQFVIPELELLWQGKDTQIRNSSEETINNIWCKGTIDIKNMNFVQPESLDFDTDLILKDTKLIVNFPEIFNGDVEVKNCKIKGPYVVPFSKNMKEKIDSLIATEEEIGPVVYADIAIANGSISMPKLGKKNPKPSFLLNLQCIINEDIFVEGSILGEGFLAGLANNFYLKVEKLTDSFKVYGSLNAPVILGKLNFEEGSVNALNRTFTLLSETEQKRFYQNETIKIYKNNLSFSTNKLPGSQKQILSPILDLKALTEITIEKPVSTANIDLKIAVTEKINKGVIVLFNGSIYQLNSIKFEEYLMPQTKESLTNLPVLENQYTLDKEEIGKNPKEILDLFQTLMPDIITNASYYYDDFSVYGFAGEKTKQLVNEMGTRQINLWAKSIIRPYEKRLAKNIGLYDIRLDYNMGNQILKTTSGIFGYGKGYGSEENTLGLNLIQNLLLDQLFLRIKTDIDLTPESRRARLSEIEINYFILKNLSLTFTNINEDYETTQFQQKFSLKWSYEF